ncbi:MULTISPECIES: hypothetical protein [Synechococcales]|nr:hypothetical protein [Synechococcus sp. CS-1333]
MRSASGWGDCRRLQLRCLTLRRGILFEQEWILWCDEVTAFLEALR